MEGWGWGGRRVLNAAIVLLSAAITVAMSTYYKQLRACFYDIDTGGYVLVVAGYSFLCSRFLTHFFPGSYTCGPPVVVTSVTGSASLRTKMIFFFFN